MDRQTNEGWRDGWIEDFDIGGRGQPLTHGALSATRLLKALPASAQKRRDAALARVELAPVKHKVEAHARGKRKKGKSCSFPSADQSLLGGKVSPEGDVKKGSAVLLI